MSPFIDTIVDMLKGQGFLNHPALRKELHSEVSVMARDGYLVVVHGPYSSEYDKRAAKTAANIADDSIVSQFDPEQDRRDAIQHEFEKYLEEVIVPIIDYYSKMLNPKSVKFVMPSGGLLKLPADLFDSRGVEAITGTLAEGIRIDLPGIGVLISPEGEQENADG